MTHITDSRSKRRPAKIAAGLAVSALLLLGPLVTMATAEQQGGVNNNSVRDRNRSQAVLRHSQERSERDQHYGDWGGGYYSAPPVVYGSPYGGGYYGSPPPVIYGPGLNINIW